MQYAASDFRTLSMNLGSTLDKNFVKRKKITEIISEGRMLSLRSQGGGRATRPSKSLEKGMGDFPETNVTHVKEPGSFRERVL